MKVNYENRRLLRVNIDAKGAGSSVVIVPRIIPASGKRDYAVDFVTGISVTDSRYKQLKAEIGDAIDKVFGYELVTLNGNPVYDFDKKGNSYYIYKAVNLYGYPGLSVEYNLFPRSEEQRLNSSHT